MTTVEAAGTGSDGPPRVAYSCVLDPSPLRQYQSLIWIQSLLAVSTQPRPQILVHAIHGCEPVHLDHMRQMGGIVEEVSPFDARHAHSNKLVQLGCQALLDADFVVLCDCDVIFSRDISSHVRGSAVRAKVVDMGEPDADTWRRVMRVAGLPPEAGSVRASHADRETYRCNFNGGLYILPKSAFGMLATAWPQWNDWVLDRLDDLGPVVVYYADQVSFGLAVTELGLDLDPLPSSLNFPTHISYNGPDRDEVDPLVLHYHQHIGRDGRLRLTGMRGVDAAIRVVNERISLASDDPASTWALEQWRQSDGSTRASGWRGFLQRQRQRHASNGSRD